MHDRDFVSSPYPTSGRDLQNRTKKFPNTTSGLVVSPAKTKNFWHLLNFNYSALSGPNFVRRSSWRASNMSPSLGSVLIT